MTTSVGPQPSEVGDVSTSGRVARWLPALPFLIVMIPGLIYGLWGVVFGTHWAEAIIEFNDDA